ncbi:uncharacterized protein SCO4629-like [Mytilus californianus]|uniref:uncharacterized protein SCO4629-like n=1 Tax=Mytilus californianus TaxID=6549 RepID=UPI002246BA0C|nr:uncharacterized protein SCO4629-like [Mytilus californianus]
MSDIGQRIQVFGLIWPNSDTLIRYFTFVFLFVCVETKHAKDHCPVIPSLHIDAALKIWNYLRIDDRPVKGDIIIALGSHDIRVADRAAELWHDRYAEYILFSGKSGNLTRGKWKKTEAEIFRDVAIAKGVPENRIIIETESTNTGENVRFSYRLLRNRNDLPSNAILVQKPYMGRRTLATFQKQWPGPKCKICVTSPNINLLDYPNSEVGDLVDVITTVLGDMQRMGFYAKSGYQTFQRIPDDVWSAFSILRRSGMYNGHLV